MAIKHIRNEEEHQRALARLDQIFDARNGSKEGEELEALASLILKYEDAQYPIDVHDLNAEGPEEKPA